MLTKKQLLCQNLAMTDFVKMKLSSKKLDGNVIDIDIGRFNSWNRRRKSTQAKNPLPVMQASRKFMPGLGFGAAEGRSASVLPQLPQKPGGGHLNPEPVPSNSVIPLQSMLNQIQSNINQQLNNIDRQSNINLYNNYPSEDIIDTMDDYMNDNMSTSHSEDSDDSKQSHHNLSQNVIVAYKKPTMTEKSMKSTMGAEDVNEFNGIQVPKQEQIGNQTPRQESASFSRDSLQTPNTNITSNYDGVTTVYDRINTCDADQNDDRDDNKDDHDIKEQTDNEDTIVYHSDNNQSNQIPYHHKLPSSPTQIEIKNISAMTSNSVATETENSIANNGLKRNFTVQTFVSHSLATENRNDHHDPEILKIVNDPSIKTVTVTPQTDSSSSDDMDDSKYEKGDKITPLQPAPAPRYMISASSKKSKSMSMKMLSFEDIGNASNAGNLSPANLGPNFSPYSTPPFSSHKHAQHQQSAGTVSEVANAIFPMLMNFGSNKTDGNMEQIVKWAGDDEDDTSFKL